MGLRIQNNVEAFNAHRQLTQTSNKAAKAMERLSSGYRVNRAADDAAGLAISEKMRAQIGGLAQAQRNAQDAVSLVQTAEGALTEVHAMLQRIRDLKVQHSNATLDATDKAAIEAEVAQLATEINDIATKTEFNGIALFSGAGVTFQVGANAGDVVTLTLADITDDASFTAMAEVLALAADPTGLATLALSGGTDSIDVAIQEVSSVRANFGAVQNRLEHRLNNLATYQENLVAAESRIRDVDMAQEMVNFSKLQILQQAGTAMLAQANQAPQGVLSLLR
jgi:flagellin